jgi:hypothetical protein
MPVDTDTSSDESHSEVEDSRHDELAQAIEEFDEGETPSEDEVREAFLS